MLPTDRLPTHPGEILKLEFLEPMNLTEIALAQHLNISVEKIIEVVQGKQGITPKTAWLFSQAFGTTPQFWMNLQTNYDLALSRPKERVELL